LSQPHHAVDLPSAQSCVLRFRIEPQQRIFLHVIFRDSFQQVLPGLARLAVVERRRVTRAAAPGILASACLLVSDAANLRAEQQKPVPA